MHEESINKMLFNKQAAMLKSLSAVKSKLCPLQLLGGHLFSLQFHRSRTGHFLFQGAFNIHNNIAQIIL